MRPENLKNDTKFDELIKNNQLPVGFGILLKRLFGRYWCVTWVYRFSYMYVKRSSRRTPLKVYRWRCRAILPHPLFKPISDVNFRHFWACAKFRDFSSMFRPSKMRLSLENNNNNNNNNNKAASSDERALAPGLTADRWLRNTANGGQMHLNSKYRRNMSK